MSDCPRSACSFHNEINLTKCSRRKDFTTFNHINLFSYARLGICRTKFYRLNVYMNICKSAHRYLIISISFRGYIRKHSNHNFVGYIWNRTFKFIDVMRSECIIRSEEVNFTNHSHPDGCKCPGAKWAQCHQQPLCCHDGETMVDHTVYRKGDTISLPIFIWSSW